MTPPNRPAGTARTARPARLARLARTALVLVAVSTIVACQSGAPAGKGTSARRPAAEGPPVVYVAVGGAETTGRGLADPLREAWSQRLYRQAFPRRTVHVNLAETGATVERALADQVPGALALEVTVATVWLGAADAEVRTPPARFRAGLEQVVERLGRGGRARVLLLLGPAPFAGGTSPMAAEVRAVAGRTTAELVDLTGIDLGEARAQQQVADRVADVLGPVR